MPDPLTEPTKSTPLTPSVYHMLLALADQERHGYGIMKEVHGRTGGALQLSTGTLYAAIRRLLDDGRIEETAPPAVADRDDDRRKYYRLTGAGREALRLETQRMIDLIGAATRKNVISGIPAELIYGER